jgi:hypothetical protein
MFVDIDVWHVKVGDGSVQKKSGHVNIVAYMSGASAYGIEDADNRPRILHKALAQPLEKCGLPPHGRAFQPLKPSIILR